MRYFITNSGNILVVESSRQFFQSPSGEFLRPCPDRELIYLMQSDLLEFTPVANFKLFTGDFPQWDHLISVPIEANYEKFKSGASNNGGAYAFYTNRHIFISRQNNGSLKFGCIDEMSSSADFPITWDGKFQSNNTTIEFSNCATHLAPVYNFQVFDEKGNREYTIHEPIEKYLDFCSIETIFAMEYTEIPEEDSEEEIQYSPIFTESLKKEVLEKISTYGELPKSRR